MSAAPDHPRLRMLDPVADGLFTAAEVAARTARRAYRRVRRRKDYAVLRPGVETPLWNELVAECRAHLGRRGEKANLARILGLSRQRLHMVLVNGTALPDAERALRLLAWLQARRNGIRPA